MQRAIQDFSYLAFNTVILNADLQMLQHRLYDSAIALSLRASLHFTLEMTLSNVSWECQRACFLFFNLTITEAFSAQFTVSA